MVYSHASRQLYLFAAQEAKLFDVANSLADVMMIMPSLNHGSHFEFGPRDLVHSLSQVLSSFRGGNPAVMSILQEKMTALGLSVCSPQRLLELSSPEEENDVWHGERSMSAPSSHYPFDNDMTLLPNSPTSRSIDGNY